MTHEPTVEVTQGATMRDAREIAGKLTPAMRRLVLASEPGAWGRADDGFGVELSGSAYRTAKSLTALKLGTYTHGSPYGDLYFNNQLGLSVRRILEQGDGSGGVGQP